MTSQVPFIKPYCNQEALDKFFWELESKLPNPPAGWEKAAKPCKWSKILEERKKKKQFNDSFNWS